MDEMLLDQDQGWFAIVEGPLDLVLGQPEIERHDGGTGLGRREEQLPVLRRVAREVRDAVSLCDPGREKSRGAAAGTSVEFGVGDRAPVAVNGDRVWSRRTAVPEEVGNRSCGHDLPCRRTGVVRMSRSRPLRRSSQWLQAKQATNGAPHPRWLVATAAPAPRERGTSVRPIAERRRPRGSRRVSLIGDVVFGASGSGGSPIGRSGQRGLVT